MAFKLGILAGMGPFSTGPFLQSVLDECKKQYGAKWDADYPHMVIYSLPTPFHPKKKIDDKKMLTCLTEGLNTLVKAEVSIIAIPCNTVHKYYKKMLKVCKEIPLLHIVDETMEGLKKKNDSLVSILGTRSIIKSGLYQKGCQKIKKEIFWTEKLQKLIDDLITTYKKKGVCDKVLELWTDVKKLLHNHEVSDVIIACTDLAFCQNHANNVKFNLHNSSRVLAKKLVNEYVIH
ncbi:MAG: aspartate/glutamate racemase family protein [Gammaproteobacteria bacterium]|jgi:aspartate racemase